MAKIKKRRLKWTASDSAQVVGYKLYWSENGEINYDSKCVALGNITELILPDGVDSFVPNGGPIVFGITALDELGNESDMTTLVAPYQFNIPKAPDDLYLQKLDDFGFTARQDDNVDYYLTSLQDDAAEAHRMRFDPGPGPDLLEFSYSETHVSPPGASASITAVRYRPRL